MSNLATKDEANQMTQSFRDCEQARHLLVLSKYGLSMPTVYHDKERDLMRVEAPGFPPAVCSWSLYIQTYDIR